MWALLMHPLYSAVHLRNIRIPYVHRDTENDGLVSCDKEYGCNLCLFKIAESQISRMKLRTLPEFGQPSFASLS